jgi:hypothetical protein
MSYYKQQLEAIRFHETAAAKIKDDLYADIEVLFDEGIASRPSEENPVTAVGKFVQKLVPGIQISGADLKEKVPAARDISYRGLTAMLSQHPALVGTDEKDRHGLKLFRRIDDLLATDTAVAAE